MEFRIVTLDTDGVAWGILGGSGLRLWPAGLRNPSQTGGLLPHSTPGPSVYSPVLPFSSPFTPLQEVIPEAWALRGQLEPFPVLPLLFLILFPCCGPC